MSTFVKTPEEATNFLLQHIKQLQYKLDQEILKPEKYLPYKTNGFWSYSLEHLNDSGEYNNSHYYKPHDCKTVERIEERFNKLWKVLDDLHAENTEIKSKNALLTAHNQTIHAKVKMIMTELGIKPTYSERDLKSRARNPKSITKSAGYLTDLTRDISLSDGSSNIFHNIDRFRNNLKAWRSSAIQEIHKVEQAKALDEKEIKKKKFIATMNVKYNLPFDSEEDEILEAILAKDKYLRLAYYLEQNRNDWNDGYDFAERGIDGFIVETEEDQLIYNDISDRIENWDGDGRTFRDSDYGYSHCYSLADDDTYTDLQNYRELFDRNY